MERPLLTFACELGPVELAELFADPAVIADLQVLGARVALALSDFSGQRAAVVQQLNAASIPVVGIPLLPLGDGYYFTTDNAAKAATRYGEFRQCNSTDSPGMGSGWTLSLTRTSTSR